MGEKTAGFKDDTKTGLKEKEYQSDRRVEFSVLGKIIKQLFNLYSTIKHG